LSNTSLLAPSECNTQRPVRTPVEMILDARLQPQRRPQTFDPGDNR